MNDNPNKKSLSYKIQKNPLIFGIIVIVAAIVIIGVISLANSITKRVSEIQTETTTEITTTEVVSTTDPTALDSDGFKKYDQNIRAIEAKHEYSDVLIKLEFTTRKALLQAHFSDDIKNIKAVPVFCFYINKGTEIKCPAEMKISGDGMSVEYILSDIDDLKNAAALTDELILDFDNVLTDVKFNLSLMEAGDPDIRSTLVGTYAQKSEDFEKKHPNRELVISEKAEGVTKIDFTLTDKFAWIDIYYKDSESYNELNHGFEKNFVSYKFEHKSNEVKRDFITKEFGSIRMMRCKLDSYAVEEISKDIGDKKLTLKSILDNRITVWTSDYETDIPLFVIEGIKSLPEESTGIPTAESDVPTIPPEVLATAPTEQAESTTSIDDGWIDIS